MAGAGPSSRIAKAGCYDELPRKRALNSAVECHPHTVEVIGSNPIAPTIFPTAYGGPIANLLSPRLAGGRCEFGVEGREVGIHRPLRCPKPGRRSRGTRRYSDGEGLPAFFRQCVLGFRNSPNPKTRNIGAGATPFALALSRVNFSLT